jgi:hypothetical protein
VSFSSILEQYGVPYYLKVDIEGLDLACVEALQNFTERPRYVSVETEATFGPSEIESAYAELDLFVSLGYTSFKCVSQKQLQYLNGTKLSIEGMPVTYIHADGSRGPFGEETPGAWLNMGQAKKRACQLVTRHNWMGFGGKHARRSWVRALRHISRAAGVSIDDWYDLHAKAGP